MIVGNESSWVDFDFFLKLVGLVFLVLIKLRLVEIVGRSLYPD